MNTLVLLVPMIILCFASTLLLIRDTKTHTNEYLKPVTNKNVAIYVSFMLVLMIAVGILFCTLYGSNNIFISVKRISLLSLLWPIAYIDFKSYRIPNTYIITGLVSRCVILVFELFWNEYVWITLLSEVIAAAALFVAAVLCSLFIKNSIGFGDIKLFIVMGLLLGLDGIWGAIFLSLIVSFFISAYLLITKKKTHKDAIPFGPAIVIGTFLSVCLTGM